MTVSQPLDFAALYRDHSGPVFQLALRLMRDKSSAMDATQETFAKAFAAAASFRAEAKPSTWLFRIAYNHCLELLSRANGMQSLEGLDFRDSIRSRPEAQAQSRETVLEVRRALSTLDEEDRRLLCLQMEKDLRYEDLADILGCSQDAVRQRVSRARRRLREILAPSMEERS